LIGVPLAVYLKQSAATSSAKRCRGRDAKAVTGYRR